MSLTEFVDIPGYSNYEINRLGEVFRKENTIRDRWNPRTRQKPRLTDNAYIRVNVMPDGGGVCKLVNLHRLLALTFIPGYFEGATVNHRDKDKLNNSLDNLEWISMVENINHGHNKKIRQITLEGDEVGEFESAVKASEFTGIHRTGIADAANTKSRRKTAGGFKWEYI